MTLSQEEKNHYKIHAHWEEPDIKNWEKENPELVVYI